MVWFVKGIIAGDVTRKKPFLIKIKKMEGKNILNPGLLMNSFIHPQHWNCMPILLDRNIKRECGLLALIIRTLLRAVRIPSRGLLEELMKKDNKETK